MLNSEKMLNNDILLAGVALIKSIELKKKTGLAYILRPTHGHANVLV